jgi:hypothetical protein
MDQRIIVLTAKGAVIILRHRRNEFEVEQTLQLNGIPPTTGHGFHHGTGAVPSGSILPYNKGFFVGGHGGYVLKHA